MRQSSSCNLVYVATTGALTTLDIVTLQPVSTLNWHGGGRSSPVISSRGYVYVAAATGSDGQRRDKLHVRLPATQPSGDQFSRHRVRGYHDDVQRLRDEIGLTTSFSLFMLAGLTRLPAAVSRQFPKTIGCP